MTPDLEDLPPAHARKLRRLRRLSWLLDAAWRVPGTRFRVGVDAMIGLVPGVGDLAGAAVTFYLLHQARSLGVSRAALVRMTGNAMLEVTVGAIPLVGDLFDASFKANLRNLRLLEAALARDGMVLPDEPLP